MLYPAIMATYAAASADTANGTAALSSKVGAAPAVYCLVATKLIDNLLDLPTDEASRMYRLILANAENDDWIAPLVTFAAHDDVRAGDGDTADTPDKCC